MKNKEKLKKLQTQYDNMAIYLSYLSEITDLLTTEHLKITPEPNPKLINYIKKINEQYMFSDTEGENP